MGRATLLRLTGAIVIAASVSGQQFVQAIYSPNPTPNGEFGRAVASDGSVLIVGAPNEDLGHGRGYVYWRQPGQASWSLASTLPPGVGGDLGENVALVGTMAALSSRELQPGGTNGSGVILIYDVSNPFLPVLQQVVYPASGSTFASFAEDFAMSARWLVVGSLWELDVFGNSTGVVWVFERLGGAWVERTRFAPANAHANDHFGKWLALSGDTVLATSAFEDNLGCHQCGVSYLFDISTTPPTQLARIDRTHAVAGSSSSTNFGQDLQLDSTQALIGDPGSSPTGIHRYVPDPSTGTWIWDSTITGSRPLGFNLCGLISPDSFIIVRNEETIPLAPRGRYVAMRQCRGHWTETDVSVGAPQGLLGSTIGGLDAHVNDGQLISGSIFVTAPGFTTNTGAVLVWDVGTAFEDAPCATLGDPVCVATSGPCPCSGNPAPGSESGCLNSTGVGGRLRAIGQPSVSHQDLQLVADGLPPDATALCTLTVPWTAALPAMRGAGLSCTAQAPNAIRLTHADQGGIATIDDPYSPSYVTLAGLRLLAELHYRDTQAATCGTGFNVTNGLALWVLR